MPRLSVVMIVKNEAECLAECLDSVREIADEIVIADTGSTDDTIAIARRYGADVFSIPWNRDFAEARNRALAAATGDWILHMDADETLDSDGAARIRALVDADGNGAEAISITLANYCDDARAWRWKPVEAGNPNARGKAGFIPVELLRLFRNGRGFQYREAVHENITESVRDAGGAVRDEEIVIHHHGYGRNAVQKGQRYLAIAREKVLQRPYDAKAWLDLAEQLLALGETDEAERAARRAMEQDAGHLGAATTLANILLNRDALDDAKAVLEKLVANGETAAHVRVALGAIVCKQGRLHEARRLLEEALQENDSYLMGRLYLARVLDLLGDVSAAHKQLEQAVEIAPTLNEAADRLKAHSVRQQAQRAFSAGNLRHALELLVEALKRDGQDPVIHFALGVVMNTFNERGRASESFQRACVLAPSVGSWDRRVWPPITSE